MPWVRLDEGFPEHPKVLAIGGDAAWLHVCAIAYCNRNLTDGYVPEHILARLSDRRRPLQLATRLVGSGMWESAKGGWKIHDYLEYQASKAKVEEDRSKARERMARNRQSSPEHSPEPANDVRPNIPVRSPYPSPSRSDPIPKSSSSSSNGSGKAHPPDDDDDRINHAIEIHAAYAARSADNPRSYQRKVQANDRRESVPDLLRHIETHPGVSAQDLARTVFDMSVVDVRQYDPRRK